MQGRKIFTPKMLYSISLQELVPKNNFYRKLLSLIDFHWLYKETASYYGSEGQESIDPVVFFKICMVGYINNIASDRKLIEFCSDSLAIRLFLGYDIDESLPGILLSAEQGSCMVKTSFSNCLKKYLRNVFRAAW